MQNIENQINSNFAIIEPCMYLNPKEAVEYIKSEHGIRISESTLAKFRHEGKPPSFNKFGNRVYYTETELDAWVHQEMIKYQEINNYKNNNRKD